MVWIVPDKGTKQDNRQSILFETHLDVLSAGIRGIDCVLSGGAVTAQSTPDMTLAVAKAAVMSNGVLLPVTAGNVTITAADATYPRFDLVVANSSGTKAVRAGTPSATPRPPARTANDVVLAVVWVPAGDVAISNEQVVDMRMLMDQGPVTIKKTTAAVTKNTTSAQEVYFTVTLPSGLFLSGKTMRVKCGGNMLINSGTPTVTVIMAYGGTTMFNDVSTAFTASAIRRPWSFDIVLQAQANNDQALVVNSILCNVGALGANPATGLGDAWSAALCVAPLTGSAAVDSDAGDRTFTVEFTMSVSNAANEIVMEYGTAELI